jgi:hypothetical protein
VEDLFILVFARVSKDVCLLLPNLSGLVYFKILSIIFSKVFSFRVKTSNEQTKLIVVSGAVLRLLGSSGAKILQV